MSGTDALDGEPPTAGLVLAGGLARRMGGGDKPLATLGGRTLAARVAGRLGPQCVLVLLNANGDPARFAATGLPVVPDGLPDAPGPLAGILAGLDWLAAHAPAIAWMASVPGDAPFLPTDFVARLHRARRQAGTPLASASSGGRLHPVHALWPVALRDALRHALTVEGERRVGRWSARLGSAAADWPVDPVDPFFNVNAPADLDAAERLLQAVDASGQ